MVTIDLRTPENEDWIKFRSWDLHTVQTVKDVFHFLRDSGALPEKSTIEEEEAALKKLITLPSFNSAPNGLKEGIALWLNAICTSTKSENPVSI